MTKVSKAKVAEIDYGFKKVQGLMKPNGEYCIGVSQIAEFFQLNKAVASREVKALLGADFQLTKVQSELNPKPINAVDLKTFAEISLKLAIRGDKTAEAFCLASIQETHERRFNKAFGVNVSEAQYNQVFEKRMLKVREQLRLAHGGFQLQCERNHFVARHVHDYATKLILGRTATESINELPINPELLEYETYSKDFVGLNHVLDEEYDFLESLSKFKIVFSSKKPRFNEDWKKFTERVIVNI